MTLFDVFLGDGAALRETEKALREQEDKVFRLVDCEDRDLSVHVRADIPRFEVLNLRQRFGQARQDRASSRQLFLLVAGFLLVYAKLFGSLDYLLKLLQAV
jgi:hypothetical protein